VRAVRGVESCFRIVKQVDVHAAAGEHYDANGTQRQGAAKHSEKALFFHGKGLFLLIRAPYVNIYSNAGTTDTHEKDCRRHGIFHA
jgi:hypothetical protein